jgi:metal-sulfur cluster biosynthetic enzyme
MAEMAVKMPSRDEMLAALQDICDPEIPVSIVDLGLVYDIQTHEGTPGKVHVQMTLTTMGCPMAGFLVAQVKERLQQMPGVEECYVELVWNPPWTPDFCTEDGKEQLSMLGIPV